MKRETAEKAHELILKIHALEGGIKSLYKEYLWLSMLDVEYLRKLQVRLSETEQELEILKDE